MTVRTVFPYMMLIAAISVTGCSNSPSSGAETGQNAVAEKPAPVAPQPEEKPQDPSKIQTKQPPGATPENPPKAQAEGQAPAPPKAKPPAGPTGYITRKNISLQGKPEPDAPKTREFKIYEEVVILETKMTDEHGRQFDVPQWYKVRCIDGREGWVIAKGLSVN